MSILDPVEAIFDEKHEYWFLKQGNETFYDAERRLRTWKSAQGALSWAMDNLPGYLIAGLPDPPDTLDQPRLF